MDAGKDAAQMAAHLVSAHPYAAGAFAVAVEDQRLDVMRLHEGVLVDSVLRLRSLRFADVQNARVVADARKRPVECRYRGFLVGGACGHATRADERGERRQKMFPIHGSLLGKHTSREARPLEAYPIFLRRR